MFWRAPLWILAAALVIGIIDRAHGRVIQVKEQPVIETMKLKGGTVCVVAVYERGPLVRFVMCLTTERG